MSTMRGASNTNMLVDWHEAMLNTNTSGIHRTFERSSALFSELSGTTVAILSSVGADIALVVEPDGTISDFAYQDATLDAWSIEDWLGRPLAEIVTPECIDKVYGLFDEGKSNAVTRKRQVNHAAAGMPDLPVAYRLVAIDGVEQKLAIGEDYRKIAEIQQRLVQTQFELETEYRKIREAEGRYRTIFQKSDQAIIVIDGENGTIIDANMAAATTLGAKRAKLNGDPIVNCFIRTDRAAIINAVNQSRHSGSLKTFSSQLAINEAPINVTLEPYRENGRTNLLVTLHEADSKKVDHAMAANQALVLDSFPEALVTIDLKGNIIEVNDQFLDLVHVLNKGALKGRNLNNWLGASNVDMQVLLTRLRDERQVRQFGSIVRDELGEQVQVLVSASRYGEGDDARIGVFISDTPRRESNLTVPAPGSNGESSDFAELVGRVPLKDLIREASDVIEKMCIEAALRQTENNRASAADMLGLSRQSLYIKLKRHGLENYDGTSQS